MQMPIGSEPVLNPLGEHGKSDAPFPPRLVLSFESQMKLRGLYSYVDAGQMALDEIRRDLSLDGSYLDGHMNLQKASEGLEKFCVEADSWGFDALYEVALGLQMLLLDCSDRIRSNDFQELLKRGLSMLSALLGQCERDFYWRLAIADLIESLEQARPQLG